MGMQRLFIFLLLFVLLMASFLGGTWYNQRHDGKHGDTQGNRRILHYVDPMNPQNISDKPGIAPCGMPMEAVYADEETPPGSSGLAHAALPGTVRINDTKQQIVGIQTGEVDSAPQTHGIRALGRIAADENRTFPLIASADGFIWDIHGITTGSLVQKDQLLATFYVREFFGRQQQYFFGLEYHERTRKAASSQAAEPAATESPSTAEHTAQTADDARGRDPKPRTPPPYQFIKTDFRGTRDQVELAFQELIDLGVGEYQLDALARTRQYAQYIEIRSPATGLVLSRNISPRQKFAQGTTLLTVADLSRVWIVADLFEREAGFIRPGMEARVALPDQSKVFSARVSEILPQFDGSTRTLKVRLAADNPEFALRPEMFVDVDFHVMLPPSVSVPAGALIDAGRRKIVYVALGEGYFEPRAVETGWRFGDRVEIVSGLKAGERIVLSGNFLIDSESRMRLAAMGLMAEAPAPENVPSARTQAAAPGASPVGGSNKAMPDGSSPTVKRSSGSGAGHEAHMQH